MIFQVSISNYMLDVSSICVTLAPFSYFMGWELLKNLECPVLPFGA